MYEYCKDVCRVFNNGQENLFPRCTISFILKTMSYIKKTSDKRPDALQWAATACVAIFFALLLAGVFAPALTPLTRGFFSLYFFLMEFLFYFAETNEAILFVSIVCLALALLIKPLKGALLKIPAPVGKIIYHGIWGFLSFLAVLAQFYVIAFAFFAQKVYFICIIALSVAAFLLIKKGALKTFRPATREIDADKSPAGFLPFFVFAHLFLAAVAGHLATPLVHGITLFMAGRSTAAPLAYKLLILFILYLPLIFWAPSVFAVNKKGLAWAAGAAACMVIFAFAPVKFAALLMGGATAVVLSIVMYSMGLRLVHLAHPHPGVMFTRLLVLSLLALNAITIHYGTNMWNCAASGESSLAVRKISDTAGVFDVALTPKGDLLVSLREDQRFIAVNIKSGKERTLFNTPDIIKSTGGLFSWTEPETLLPIQNGERFLLLIAVSDDENLNRVAVLGGDYAIEGFVDALPKAGISDFVTDGAGSVYVSTEFENNIFVLDQETLTVKRTIVFPEAETNKILVVPQAGRMYSLGLWTDPMLRVFDLGENRQVNELSVGTRSWDMAFDAATERLFIPRMISGKVLIVDVRDFKISDKWELGFGVRPVELWHIGRKAYLGNMYSGKVAVFDLDSGAKVFESYLGGYIKNLKVDEKTGKAYVGCACGIFEIDPAKF